MSVMDSTRTRTITWSDPLAALEAGRGLSGLEYLRQIMQGDIPPPPIAPLMGMTIVSLESGLAVFAAEPAEFHYNPIGVVHGGLAMTLLDSAMGCAVQSTLPAGVAYTTLETKVNFVRPMTAETGRVLSEGKLVYGGGTIATAEGRLFAEASGKLLAHGTTTCLILREPRAPAGHGGEPTRASG